MKALKINSNESNLGNVDMKISYQSANRIHRSKIPFSQMKHGKFSRMLDRHEPIRRSMLDNSLKIREFKF